MDARTAAVAKKLQDLLDQATAAAVELSRLDGTLAGVPHYSAIELHAHELGRRLSRQIQRQQMNEVAAEQLRPHACPTCRTLSEVTTDSRQVDSIDGEVELQEVVSYCRKCRRSFFPESRRTRI